MDDGLAELTYTVTHLYNGPTLVNTQSISSLFEGVVQ